MPITVNVTFIHNSFIRRAFERKRFYLEDNNFYIVAVASKWYLAYLVTYYFTFIYTAIIDSIIGSIATCNIKKRCLCPSIFDSKGCHSISKDFQSAFDIDILFHFYLYCKHWYYNW